MPGAGFWISESNSSACLATGIGEQIIFKQCAREVTYFINLSSDMDWEHFSKQMFTSGANLKPLEFGFVAVNLSAKGEKQI